MKQILDSTISNINVDKIILVDNASENKKEIDEYIKIYKIKKLKCHLKK